MNIRALRIAASLALAAVTLTACGVDASAGRSEWSVEDPVTVTLLTHDSFVISEDQIAELAADGIELVLLRGGDAGAVVNQAILTKSAPDADVLFGIDSTRLTRGLDEDLFQPFRVSSYDALDPALLRDDQDRVTPIDVSDVCINLDLAAFGDGLAAPTTLDDLADPAYAGMLVVQNPATSSPGLAFLFRTISEFGEDGWQGYWERLVANDVEITAGWEDAYYGVFSGGAGAGDRPLVVSYSTSPPAEVLYSDDPDATEAPTGSMIDSCYRQVEFAGLLTNAPEAIAGQQVLEYLTSVEFQTGIALSMFVEPARTDVELPEVFVRFADRPVVPTELDAELIDSNRERWIAEWTELVLGG
jgi:thiamine transport system substrate-binding protein